MSSRLKVGEHVMFSTHAAPDLECYVMTAEGDNFNIHIYDGTQTNIIGNEIARYMKRTKVNFSNIINLD